MTSEFTPATDSGAAAGFGATSRSGPAARFGTVSRFGTAGSSTPRSTRWDVARLTEPNRLWGANGIAFGPDGRLHVAQVLGGQISAVDTTSGDVEVVVGQDGPVRTPDDVAFGAGGEMYIADIAPGRVWRRDAAGELDLVASSVRLPNGITCLGDRLFVNEMRPDGELVELFGSGAEPALLTGGLAMGNAMQIGPDGKLYYPHMRTGQVWRIAPDGGVPELAAEVGSPVAVRFDRAGTLVVLSTGPAGLITRIDLASGNRTEVVTGIGGLDNAAFDDENRMFVSSFAHGGVMQVQQDGRSREIVRRGLNGPYGIAAGRGGTVYAVDHFSLARTTDSGAVASVDVVGGGMPTFARGAAADGDGLALSTVTGEVHAYDPQRRSTRRRASGLGELTGIAVGPGGEVVVAASGSGRVLRLDESDEVQVLADGLDHPVGVAVDDAGACYVGDDRRGQVLRLDDEPVVVADGLGEPQGIAVLGDELLVIEVEHRWLRRICLRTGASTIEAEDLAVGLPPGGAEPPDGGGMTYRPPAFADLAVAPDGSVLVAANGEGSVLRLRPPPTA